MNKQIRLLSYLLLVGGIASSGCVSTKNYKKLETDKNASIQQLQQEVTDLQTQNAALDTQVKSLETKSDESSQQYEQLVSQLANEVQDGQLKITQYQNMLTVDVAEKIFFDSGKAKLKEEGKKVLAKVGDALKGYPDKIIRVVGHTDNVPLSKSYRIVFPTNWELSVIRASNVVRFLQEESKIPGDHLMAVGRGEYDPISPNTTPEGRQQNRRIEITLLDKSLVDAVKMQEKANPPKMEQPQ